MYSELDSLFKDLITHHGRSKIYKDIEFKMSLLDFPLHKDISIMPRYNNVDIISIARQAKDGDLTSMFTLSRLYLVGLGLPVSRTLACVWQNFSLQDVSIMPFQKAVDKLKSHLLDLDKSAYSLPKVLTRISANIVQQYKVVRLNKLPAKLPMRVMPKIQGISCSLIYRVYKDVDTGNTICYLYDCRVNSEHRDRISLDVAQKLNVPFVLGSIGHSETIPDYVDRVRDLTEDRDVSYFVVEGVIALPNSKKKILSKSLPKLDTNNLNNVINYFVNTINKPRTVLNIGDQIKELEKDIKDVEREMRANSPTKTLRSNRDKLKRIRHKIAKTASKEAVRELKIKARTIIKLINRIKSPHYVDKHPLKKLELEKELKKLKEGSKLKEMMHDHKYLENSLTFIASDIYSGHKSSVNLLPINTRVKSHLESLGFSSTLNTLNFNCLEVRSITSNMDTIMDKFNKWYSDFEVCGIIARPIRNKTVNKKKVYITNAYIINKE